MKELKRIIDSQKNISLKQVVMHEGNNFITLLLLDKVHIVVKLSGDGNSFSS